MGSAQDIINNLARDYAIAWSSGDAKAVAAFFAPDGQITINRSEPLAGHDGIAAVAQDMFDTFPDLELRCDMMRRAGNQGLFVWTFEGHHAETGNLVVSRGWEIWELGEDNIVLSADIWFDDADYQRQVGDGQGL